MIQFLVSFALLALLPVVPALPQESPPPGPPAQVEARLDEWNAYIAGESSTPPRFTGKKWTSPRAGPAVRLLLGGRFAHEDIAPLEESYDAGLELGLHGNDAGLSIDLGLAYSRDDDEVFVETKALDLTGEAFELYAGPRWASQWGASTKLYFGLGGSLTRVELENVAGAGTASLDATVFGIYTRAGVEWSIAESARLGVDVRHTFSESSDFGGSAENELDATVVSLVLGFEL